eukprot:5959715-Amphidinium_carterae.1
MCNGRTYQTRLTKCINGLSFSAGNVSNSRKTQEGTSKGDGQTVLNNFIKFSPNHNHRSLACCPISHWAWCSGVAPEFLGVD